MSSNLESLSLVLPDIANPLVTPVSAAVLTEAAVTANTYTNVFAQNQWVGGETITVKYTLRGRYENGREAGTLASPASVQLVLTAGNVPTVSIPFADLVGAEGVDVWVSLDPSPTPSDQSFRHYTFVPVKASDFRNDIPPTVNLTFEMVKTVDYTCGRTLSSYLATRDNTKLVYQYLLADFGTNYAAEGHVMQWEKTVTDVEFLGFTKRIIEARDVKVGINTRYQTAREFLRQAVLAGGQAYNDYLIEYGSGCECLQYFGLEGDIAGDAGSCGSDSKLLRFYVPNVLGETIDNVEWQLINGSKSDVLLTFAADQNDIVGSKGLAYIFEEAV